ncbi:glycosyltransferase [Acidobacteria bacterium AH-259-L09]|nr:glycosyltransferase [Acidobacteria bacterium AH-259-L09]
MMYRDRKITVVIPCLNEQEGIQHVLARMPEFVDEVIVVDNDSTDETPKIAEQMGARVIQERVRGYGRAYKTGLLHTLCFSRIMSAVERQGPGIPQDLVTSKVPLREILVY